MQLDLPPMSVFLPARARSRGTPRVREDPDGACTAMILTTGTRVQNVIRILPHRSLAPRRRWTQHPSRYVGIVADIVQQLCLLRSARRMSRVVRVSRCVDMLLQCQSNTYLISRLGMRFLRPRGALLSFTFSFGGYSLPIKSKNRGRGCISPCSLTKPCAHSIRLILLRVEIILPSILPASFVVTCALDSGPRVRTYRT